MAFVTSRLTRSPTRRGSSLGGGWGGVEGVGGLGRQEGWRDVEGRGGGSVGRGEVGISLYFLCISYHREKS